jgi:hypothetical protein
MKIVQSLYTGCFLNNDTQNLNSVVTPSGYIQKKLYWYTWISSLFSFLEKGYKVQLVTDDVGKEILVDKLGLPYSDVNLSLNELHSVTKKCWAAGKIKAYSIQTEPFLHFDNDAFFTKPIPKVTNPIFVQEIRERVLSYNDIVSNSAKDIVLYGLDDIPSQLTNYVKNYKENQYYNSVVAGVIGGNDIELLNKYSTTIYNFIYKNGRKFDELLENKHPEYATLCMSLLEEQMLVEFVKEKYGDINQIQSVLGHNKVNTPVAEIEQRSVETGYVHFMNRIKNGQDIRAIQYRTRFIKRTEDLYPEYCELVNIYLNN